MKTQKITKVLKKLTTLFNKNKINWVLGGSMNLFLQGIDVVPGDIDVLTTREGAFKAGELLKNWEVKGVKCQKSKDFISY